MNKIVYHNFLLNPTNTPSHSPSILPTKLNCNFTNGESYLIRKTTEYGEDSYPGDNSTKTHINQNQPTHKNWADSKQRTFLSPN